MSLMIPTGPSDRQAAEIWPPARDDLWPRVTQTPGCAGLIDRQIMPLLSFLQIWSWFSPVFYSLDEKQPWRELAKSVSAYQAFIHVIAYFSINVSNTHSSVLCVWCCRSLVCPAVVIARHIGGLVPDYQGACASHCGVRNRSTQRPFYRPQWCLGLRPQLFNWQTLKWNDETVGNCVLCYRDIKTTIGSFLLRKLLW